MDDIEKFPEEKPEGDNNDEEEEYQLAPTPDGENDLDKNEGDNYDWDNYEDLDSDLIGYLKDRPSLIEKFDAALRDIRTNKEEEEQNRKFREYKKILVKEIEIEKLKDKLNEDAWNKELNLEEQERLLWEQRIKNLNSALNEHGITLDPNNFELYNFIRENLEETLTEKKREINGYKFKNSKIIKKEKSGNFVTIDGKKLQEFLGDLQKYTVSSARSELVDLLGVDENIETTARECLNELREQENSIIERTRTWIEMQDLRPDLVEREEAIENLKNNKRTNLSKSVLKKTLEGKIKELKDWAKENKTTLGVGVTSFLISLISGLSSTIPIVEKIKEAGKSLKKVGNVLENAGKKLKKLGNRIDNIFSDPVKALGASVSFFGRFLQDFPDLPFVLLIIILIVLILYIINKWRERY